MNDFYGGTANIDGSQEADPGYGESHRPSQAHKSRPWTRTRPQRPPMPQGYQSDADIASGKHVQRPSRLYGSLSKEDDLYLSEPPDGNWRRGEWIHAAKEVASPRDPSAEHTVMSLEPTLVVTRRGRRLTSDPFLYEKGWTDMQFAEELKYQYASLKLRDVGLFQKLVAYRQIHYVNVLQYRFTRKHHKWMIVKSMPITNKGDKEGRDAFMYLLRYPRENKFIWTGTIDNVAQPGAILKFEVLETFDSSKINIAIIMSALLSLGVSLAYGFAMDRDFSTGFTIGSWLITAAGFIAALVSISEYAGQESMLDEMG